jgi:hypothetical protein
LESIELENQTTGTLKNRVHGLKVEKL